MRVGKGDSVTVQQVYEFYSSTPIRKHNSHCIQYMKISQIQHHQADLI